MAARPARTVSPPEPRWLSDEEQQAWIAVAQLTLLLPGALDAQLQRDSAVSFFEYSVLSRLSMTPDHTLRMSELAEMAGGSLSRLSNVVKRLETRGFVRREPDPANGRFTNAILTPSGWEKVVAAAPGHVAAVRRLVLDPLAAGQVAALGELGQRMAEHLRATCDEAAPVTEPCDADC